MDILIWGPLVRVIQALLAAAPTVVVGWLIAAVLERILGRANTLKLFGGHTWKQIPYAWLLGMLLPVCSLGVIPVMQQMRKSGISGGTILAFGLTAPLFNPISVLYGLTLSDPFTLFVFCLGSLSIVTVIGVVWDKLFPNSSSPPEELPPTPYGLQRIGAVALSMCQQAVGPSTKYMIWA
ncbi:MAG: permease, partial [Pirellula sp.]|nr:permease [Pirellula sp.]